LIERERDIELGSICIQFVLSSSLFTGNTESLRLERERRGKREIKMKEENKKGNK